MNAKILVILIILISSATLAQAAHIWVEPATLEVTNGENFTVNIMVDPEVNLTDDPDNYTVVGVQYYLMFNNTLLNATEQVPGDFLSHDGVETYVTTKKIYNHLGFLRYAENRLFEEWETVTGVSDPGVLASITFNVIDDPGVCELGFYNVLLSNISAQAIPDVNVSNGSVEITSSSICGNVNGDEFIDVGDVILLKNYVGYSGYTLQGNGNVNGDAYIDVGDVILLKNFVGYSGYELNCPT